MPPCPLAGPSSLRRLHQVGPDDQPLDLAGALVEPEQPDITVDPLDGHLTHVATASVNLHGEIRYVANHFGAEQLGSRRRDPAVLSGDPESGGVTDQRPSSHHAG